jgi:hypothetical protein
MRRWLRNLSLLTLFKVAEYLLGTALLSGLYISLGDKARYAPDVADMSQIPASILTAVAFLNGYYLFTGYLFIVPASIVLLSIWARTRAELAGANAASFLASGLLPLFFNPHMFLGVEGAFWVGILIFDAVLPLLLPISASRRN